MLALIAMISVIVDGGNVWAQQRIVQNGADASAEAGAIVMARRFSLIINGLPYDDAVFDAQINSAIQASITANGLTGATAYYTDICGIPLRPNGTGALNSGTEDLASAAVVGQGTIPTSAATSPDCPNLQVGPPAGVMVIGQKNVGTYLAGAVGISAIPVGTRATAVTGYLQDYCDSTQGNGCKLLPVTVPVDVLTCDNHNNPQSTGTPWVYGPIYKVPLCQNGPGNVGWIDWNGGGGGTPEIIDSVNTPNNPNINLPSWQQVAETGNVNSAGLETALRNYDGKVVLIPQFDLTCDPGNAHAVPDSTVPAINTGPNYGCPAGGLGGNGTNQWYRMPSFAFFQFCTITDPECVAVGANHGAYTNGSNSVCDSGNGATSCLIGRFVDVVASGTVGPCVGGGIAGNKTVGVQLIK